MNNSDMPAMPVNEMRVIGEVAVSANIHTGLTKREYFAGLAMQGIMANQNAEPTQNYHFTHIAQDAIKIADELLKELAK